MDPRIQRRAVRFVRRVAGVAVDSIDIACQTQTELFRKPRAGHSSLTVLKERKRGATFVEHHVHAMVNPPESTGMPFWSINPYVGCEFGCTYCYARYAHRYAVSRAHDHGKISSRQMAAYRASETWDVFEHTIFVKQHEAVLEALERDLHRIRQRDIRGQRQYPIVIGTATDPYQPAERTFQITRSILARLRREQGLGIGIITKSSLVQRDIDLLVDLQQRHRLSVYISLITTDIKIIKLFEARSPMPQVRLKALKQLTDAGINAGVIVAPVLPGITDSTQQVAALARAVHRSGGKFAHPSPLRLYPALHYNFLPIIRANYPNLYPRYRRVFQGAGAAPKHYTDAIVNRFKQIAREYGIPVEDPVLDRQRHLPIRDPDQLPLWE